MPVEQQCVARDSKTGIRCKKEAVYQVTDPFVVKGMFKITKPPADSLLCAAHVTMDFPGELYSLLTSHRVERSDRWEHGLDSSKKEVRV